MCEKQCCGRLKTRWSKESWGFTSIPEAGKDSKFWPQLWGTSPCVSYPVYLAIRIILFLCVTGVLIHSIYDEFSNTEFWGTNPTFMTYIQKLTYWQLICLQIYLTLALIACVQYKDVKIAPVSDMTMLVKCTWIFQNLCIALVPLVVILYWTLLFNWSKAPLTINVTTHFVTLLLIIPDIIFSYSPTHLKHTYQPQLIGLAYYIFSMIYTYAGGVNEYGDNYIYPTLDYNNNSSSHVTGIAMILVGIPLMYLLFALFNISMQPTVEGDMDVALRPTAGNLSGANMSDDITAIELEIEENQPTTLI